MKVARFSLITEPQPLSNTTPDQMNASNKEPKNQDPVQLLREAWATLHNLSVDMEMGPLRQQMQKRASEIRAFLDELEQPDGTYCAQGAVGHFIETTDIDGELLYLHVCEPEPGVSFPLYAGPQYSNTQVPVALIEAVDRLLEESHCDCPHKMRFDDGEHLSHCPLFDLNIARLGMLTAENQVTAEQVPITHEQALELWHISHEAHARISAFEWFQAGIIAAEHFHQIDTAPRA